MTVRDGAGAISGLAFRWDRILGRWPPRGVYGLLKGGRL